MPDGGHKAGQPPPRAAIASAAQRGHRQVMGTDQLRDCSSFRSNFSAAVVGFGGGGVRAGVNVLLSWSKIWGGLDGRVTYEAMPISARHHNA